jgi:hypothetical protein
MVAKKPAMAAKEEEMVMVTKGVHMVEKVLQMVEKVLQMVAMELRMVAMELRMAAKELEVKVPETILMARARAMGRAGRERWRRRKMETGVTCIPVRERKCATSTSRRIQPIYPSAHALYQFRR